MSKSSRKPSRIPNDLAYRIYARTGFAGFPASEILGIDEKVIFVGLTPLFLSSLLFHFKTIIRAETHLSPSQFYTLSSLSLSL